MKTIHREAGWFFFLSSVLFSILASAQKSYDWWNIRHNWDGVTHWSRYIVASPGYMGPNALPVPPLHDALLSHHYEIAAGAGIHTHSGEFTADVPLRLYAPFGNALAALEITHTIIEYYKTDTILRDERRARSRHVEGAATADINITSYWTLVRNKRFPDVILRINLRSASGTHLSNARTTDSPGYYFDLVFGKDLRNNITGSQPAIRLYGSAGFYAWQTNLDNNRQNDAFLCGLGSQIRFKPHIFSAEMAGYFGYMNLRDDPVVLRLRYNYKSGSNDIALQYQKGIHDIFYHSVHLTYTRRFATGMTDN